jgi:hypothetical protein
LYIYDYEVSNNGCCARKEYIIAWLQVLLIMLLHIEGSNKKLEVWIIRLITEAWEILLLSSSHVALNLFNGSYASMSFM